MEDGKCCGGHSKCDGWATAIWWATLVVAVLAVPSLAIIITLIVPVHGSGSLVVFVLSCWACTFLGMRLMVKKDKK